MLDESEAAESERLVWIYRSRQSLRRDHEIVQVVPATVVHHRKRYDGDVAKYVMIPLSDVRLTPTTAQERTRWEVRVVP
jgi:hypothetical protein